MRTGEFEASLEEAKLYPQLWRLLLGLLLITFIFAAGAAMLMGAFIGIANLMEVVDPADSGAALMRLRAAAQGYGGIDTPLAVFLLLITFIALFVGPMLAAAAFHFRGPGSLFGPAPEWLRGFATALGVLIPIYLCLVVIGALLDPPAPNLSFARWLSYLPFAIPLIFIQIASEELLFRGYLQQQLAARFAARWIWMGLPSVVFALLHWSTAAGDTLPFVLLSALLFGLLAADITEQTGNLGATMGIHFGNNLFGILGVAMGDSISGLALFVSPVPEGIPGSMIAGLLLSMAVLVLTWWITRRLLTR